MRLYVRNIPFQTTVTDLLQLFDEWAGKEAYVATRGDGRPAGFGFIELDEVVVELAVRALHGSDYRGRRLHVSIARKQRPQKRFDRREKAVSAATAMRETR